MYALWWLLQQVIWHLSQNYNTQKWNTYLWFLLFLCFCFSFALTFFNAAFRLFGFCFQDFTQPSHQLRLKPFVADASCFQFVSECAYSHRFRIQLRIMCGLYFITRRFFFLRKRKRKVRNRKTNVKNDTQQSHNHPATPRHSQMQLGQFFRKKMVARQSRLAQTTAYRAYT